MSSNSNTCASTVPAEQRDGLRANLCMIVMYDFENGIDSRGAVAELIFHAGEGTHGKTQGRRT